MTRRSLVGVAGLAAAITVGPVRWTATLMRPSEPPGDTALVDVSVVPMDTDRVLEHQTVVVRGGRIVALGPVGQVRVPPGAVRLDGRGRYLLPGLADMHAHLFSESYDDPPSSLAVDSARAERRLLLWLAEGVTTIRNMDHDDDVIGAAALRFRARAAAGALLSPRIYTAGAWFPRGGTGIFRFDGTHMAFDSADSARVTWPKPAEVARYVAAYKAAGYDFVKPYFEPPEIFDSLTAAARRLGLPVAGHVPQGLPGQTPWPAGQRTSLEHAIPRMTSIEHSLWEWLLAGRPDLWEHPDTTALRAIAAAMRRAGTWNCPTEAILENLRQGYRVANDPLPRLLYTAGVGLLLGTDMPGREGVIAEELEALVAAGLTPYQALVTGTRNPAVYFGTLKESGTIAVGKRADLVLLRGNPLEDIRYVERPVGVMLGGRWLPRAELDQRSAAIGWRE